METDFAGLWPHEDKLDPTCVKSQTGFVICIANCPVIWQSKLQSEIATLTTEAKCVALSVAMRSVIPFLNIARAIKTHLGLDDSKSTFEVNVTHQPTSNQDEQLQEPSIMQLSFTGSILR